MNDKQVESIVAAASAEFRMIFKTEEETARALTWMTVLFNYLTADYYGNDFMGQGVMLIPNNLPTRTKEFCEVMRVLANVMEAKIEADEKEQ